MSTVLILRGVPASGKSTFAKEWVAADPDNRVRVNRDNLRWTLGIKEGVGTHEQENEVTYWQNAMIRRALEQGKDVVVDNTNLRARAVKDLLKIAAQYGAGIDYRDFHISREQAIYRNALRMKNGERYVGPEVIGNFFDRFIGKDGSFPPFPFPSAEEGGVFKEYVPDPTNPPAIIVDIDGTLAHMNGRGPYDGHLAHTDEYDEVVADVANAWRQYTEAVGNSYAYIIVVSGRDSKYWDVTESWLIDNDFDYDELYMRPEGDMRNDAVVKDEIFEAHIANRFNVHFVLDDRNRVVQMWRAKGLKVLQVADGDF